MHTIKYTQKHTHIQAYTNPDHSDKSDHLETDLMGMGMYLKDDIPKSILNMVEFQHIVIGNGSGTYIVDQKLAICK